MTDEEFEAWLAEEKERLRAQKEAARPQFDAQVKEMQEEFNRNRAEALGTSE